MMYEKDSVGDFSFLGAGFCIQEVCLLPWQECVLGKEDVMNKGNFIIGSLNVLTNEFSAAVSPRPHLNEDAAKTEAERLARSNRHKKYVVLEVKGIVQASDVVWK